MQINTNCGYICNISPIETANLTSFGRLFLVTDDIVNSLYGEKIKRMFGISDCFVFPHGEENKNPDTVLKILRALAEKNYTRQDSIIALGGGITGDISGLCASLYMRGIRYIQVPTTLLAMVDSSVGGKTAVNFGDTKNLIGAFYNPSLVLCDTAFLGTLPKRQLACGFAEIIKTAILCHNELFEILETADTENFPYDEVIRLCIEYKATVVSRDFHDNGERQRLNLGHTFAHAIEVLSDYEILHGEAVAMGLVLACEKADNAKLKEKVISLLQKYNLPTVCPFSESEMYEIMLRDKKNKNGKISFILP